MSVINLAAAIWKKWISEHLVANRQSLQWIHILCVKRVLVLGLSHKSFGRIARANIYVSKSCFGVRYWAFFHARNSGTSSAPLTCDWLVGKLQTAEFGSSFSSTKTTLKLIERGQFCTCCGIWRSQMCSEGQYFANLLLWLWGFIQSTRVPAKSSSRQISFRALNFH